MKKKMMMKMKKKMMMIKSRKKSLYSSSIRHRIVIPKNGMLLFDVQPSKVIELEEEYKMVDFISSLVAFASFSRIFVILFLLGNLFEIFFKDSSFEYWNVWVLKIINDTIFSIRNFSWFSEKKSFFCLTFSCNVPLWIRACLFMFFTELWIVNHFLQIEQKKVSREMCSSIHGTKIIDASFKFIHNSTASGFIVQIGMISLGSKIALRKFLSYLLWDI